MFGNSSIQRKLTIVAFLTSVAGLSLACLAFELFERARFRSALVHELTAQVGTLELNPTASAIFSDQKLAQGLLRALRVERHIMAACIYDNQGRIFCGIPARSPKRENGDAGVARRSSAV